MNTFFKPLLMAAGWFLLAGCSNLSPTPEQQAAAAAKPWTGSTEKPAYEGAEAVAGLLQLLK